MAIFFSVTRWLIFFLSKWISFFLTNAIGELPLGIVRLSVGLADIEKVHELCVRAASENRCGMLAAPYVPPDIVPLADGSAHFRFGVLERKEHCLAEIEPPEAGGHSERLLPYLRTAELGKPMVVYLGDFVESAHGYLRKMKMEQSFDCSMDGYLIVAYKLMCLPDKREFGGYARQRFRLLLRGYSAKVVQRRD